MDHDQVSAILSDVRARPSDADWAAVDAHMDGCDRCTGALALFGATVAGALALLRFELAGPATFLTGPAAFGAIAAPLVIGATITALVVTQGGAPPPIATATPTMPPSVTATMTLTTTPSETPTVTVTATRTGTPRPAAPTTPSVRAGPTAPATSIPTRAPAPVGPQLPPPDCNSFWDNRPESGAGFNQAYADGLVALENQRRTAAGKAKLIPDQAAYGAAAGYARTFLETRWWEGRAVPDWHLGPDGSTLESRLRGAGAAFIARSENIFWRLGFGERVGDPCTMFESFTPTHIRNYMGEYPGVIQEPLYHGTACYVDYGARLVACVQDFIVPP